MTLKGAIKQLHELQSAEDMPFYYKPAISEVINVLLMDAQEVRCGHWIDVNGDGSLWRCSVCGGTQCCNSDYCGDCGAKMDEERVKMPRLIDADEIKKREKDVVLANGAKYRCFDTTMLSEIPTVDAEPVRHGHWIRDFTIAEDTLYKCSVCGRQECLMDKYDPKEEMPYCHCGAKMDEVK